MILKRIREIILIVVGAIYKFVKAESFRRKEFESTSYPLGDDGHLWHSRLMLPTGEWGYCAQFYKQRWYKRPDLMLDEEQLPAEILYAKKFSNVAVTSVDDSCLLPVAIKSKNNFLLSTREFNIYVNGEKKTISNVAEERYYYLQVPSKGSISVESCGNDIFLAKPIAKRSRKTGLRLVLPIFIDGLSSEFFRFGQLSELMPNTHAFFSKGTIFQNCYSTSEWSLPSIASIFTGLTTRHHGLFHNRISKVLDPNHKIMSEYFQQEGYLTTQVCNNWRKNPSMGYARGFDRTIYKKEMECTEVISEFLDFVYGFKERNIFAWLTFFDIHRPWLYRTPPFGIQPRMKIELHELKEILTKSVDSEYDVLAIKSYLHELNRVDYHLGMLYDFICKEYKNDEILVLLLADHGQSYLDDDGHILADARIRVPLMFRGCNVKQMTTDEYVQNTDILPSLLHLSGLPISKVKIDGLLPRSLGGTSERQYIFAESLFPGQTYKCVYKDKLSKYLFESEKPVGDDGHVDIQSVHLVKVSGKGDQKHNYESHLKQYLNTNVFSDKFQHT